MCMRAHEFTELVAWQLADEIRQKVIAFTSTPPCCNDRRFCTDATAAAGSAASNTSEGFGRFRPAEFRNFLRYAHGSLKETRDHLISALESKYVTEERFYEIWRLTYRAIKANEGLQRYLQDCVDNGFTPNFWSDDK